MTDPHYVASVECDLCGKNWIAVFPVEAEHLECPRCGIMRDIEDVQIKIIEE